MIDTLSTSAIHLKKTPAGYEPYTSVCKHVHLSKLAYQLMKFITILPCLGANDRNGLNEHSSDCNCVPI